METLIGCVIHLFMQDGFLQSNFRVRVEKYQVSIRPNLECPFSRIQAKEACRVGTANLYPAIEAYSTCPDPIMVDQCQTGFDAWQTAWNIHEIIFTQILLPFEEEWTVISSNRLKVVISQGFPQALIIWLGTKWWGTDEFCSIKAWTGKFPVGEQQVLGTGLSICSHAALSGATNCFDTQCRRSMHHIQTRACHLGQG